MTPLIAIICQAAMCVMQIYVVDKIFAIFEGGVKTTLPFYPQRVSRHETAANRRAQKIDLMSKLRGCE